MEDKVFKNQSNPTKGSSLEQVTTHFGSLETERIPMVISLEGLLDSIPQDEEYEKIVDSFYENLKSKHPYQYQDIIGEGGMGIVEMVKDKKCLRSIAKKTLTSSKSDTESIIRFTEEAQITAQLEHPNIVPVYDMGIDESGQLYYTMKMVKGRNLKEIIKQIKEGNKETIKKFPLSNLLEIYLAVCDAMSYACSRKIVHRDLKPDNIMVGDYGEVYIVDWGLAKIIRNGASKSADDIPEWIVKEVYNKHDVSTDKFLKELRKVDSVRTKDLDLNISFNDILIGTPQYMAPERISGEADECSEVYALGAILYNILTLEITVKGENLEEIVTKIFSEDIKSPLRFKNLPHLPGGKVPPGLAAVTMKALSAEPVDRYHTVTQLRNEIAAWEDGYITEAEKAGPWLVLWSLIKRNKIETCLAIICTSLLIIIYTFFAIKLKKDRILAEAAEKTALAQKLNVEKETAKLVEKSKEVKAKIDELEIIAPKLNERSNFYIRNDNLKKALQTIKSAYKITPRNLYLIQQANIQQTMGMFTESISLYEEILPEVNNKKFIRQSINFSKEFQGRKLSSYTDMLRFRDLLLSQNRFDEAQYISKQLFMATKNMKNNILSRLSSTHLGFINKRTLQIDSNGGFTLNLSNKNLTDISPLAGIPFKSLNLNNNPISDISFLKGMPLESLQISHTKIEDISALNGAPLKAFKAASAPIKSLASLDGAPLIYIEVQNTLITDLKGISSPFLKEANFSNTQINTLKGLSFRSLRALEINDTNVSDLTPLKNSSLKSLQMRAAQVKDIKPLANVFLTSLDLSDNPIVDFKPLKSLPLEKFTAQKTKLENIDFLKNKKLTHINLRETAVKDITALKGMPISYLNIDLNSVNDLSSIADMPLESFSYQGCKATSLPLLKNLKEFANIYLSLSNIKDFSFLENRNFKNLDFSGSNLESLENLRNSTVQSLSITRTKINDLSPLKGKSLEYLNISDCPINDLRPLSESLIDKLDCARIPATDFSPLASTNLKEIYAHGSKVSSLDFINTQTVKKLDLSSSLVTDLSPLKNSNIELLNLAHTKVEKIDVLSTCVLLTNLDLYDTQIRTIKGLNKLKIVTLILGDCSNLKTVKNIKFIKSLKKLIIPKHIMDIGFLKEMDLNILGYSTEDHGQSAQTFWEKYDKEKANE